MDTLLPVQLADTIRMTRGGLTDTLADPGGLAAWIRDHEAALAGMVDVNTITADERLRRRVIELRSAVRALFARAVEPGPPSSADLDRLPSPEAALRSLNQCAAAVPTAPELVWPSDEPPAIRQVTVAAGTADPADLLIAALARATAGFLAGPLRSRLRACPSPPCVLYFVKEHGRQEWCSTSCGNRARAARHYSRHRDHGAAAVRKGGEDTG